MEVSAKMIRAGVSAQKARLIADQIRGLRAESAVELLRFSTKSAAKLVKKVVDSAIANAAENEGADLDDLFVKTLPHFTHVRLLILLMNTINYLINLVYFNIQTL